MILAYTIWIALLPFLLLVSARAHCTLPRVRREWRSITAAERADWIEAVSCLAKKPHNPNIAASVDPTLSLIPPLTPNSSYFDDFVYVHMDLNILIHNTGFFLPWHRLYVQTFEDELRSKCGYKGAHPYWDWTQDTDLTDSIFLSSSSFDGLGTWGDPNDDYQISDGGLKDIKVAYPVPHRIRRNYSNALLHRKYFPIPQGDTSNPFLLINTTFTQDIVDFVLKSFTGDFAGFQTTTERGPHPGPHSIMGGDMSGTCPFGLQPPSCYHGPLWTPNDPIFFLHHAMVDKIWYDWQNSDETNKEAFGGGGPVRWQVDSDLRISDLENPAWVPSWLNKNSLIPGDGLWEDVKVRDIMHTVGRRLCYVYA